MNWINPNHHFGSSSFRCTTQNDEIARLQLENNIFQEKLTNEKRKVSILQVKTFSFSFSIFSYNLQSLEGQMQEMIDEKTNLNNEYQKLNQSYQQNLKEQTDLLVLCSTYEDQLKTCRNIIQTARLQVNQFHHSNS